MFNNFFATVAAQVSTYLKLHGMPSSMTVGGFELASVVGNLGPERRIMIGEGVFKIVALLSNREIQPRAQLFRE